MTAVRRQWTGAVELDVDLPDGGTMRALAYPELVGRPEPGDRVLLNAGALLMGLGTGGYALVVALPDRLPAGPAAGRRHPRRRAPGQGPVHPAAADPARRRRGGVARTAAVLAAADDLAGMPVVTADLHSALPAILAGIHADAPRRPGRRTC